MKIREVLIELARHSYAVGGLRSDAIGDVTVEMSEEGMIDNTCEHPGFVQRALFKKLRELKRRERRRRQVELVEESTRSRCSTPEDRAAARRHLVLLKASVSDRHFAVLDLGAQGCTDAEIGAELGVTAPAARALLMRARRRIH